MNSCNCNAKCNSNKKQEKEDFSLDSTKDMCHVSCAQISWTNILFCILIIILLWYVVNKNKSKLINIK